jgi:Flp pilus assembly protein TadD
MKGRIFVVLLVFVGSAVAQLSTGNNIRQVRVRVTFRGVCEAPAQVMLTGHNGPIAERAVNDRCEADFFNVAEGTYHVIVSGPNVSNADSGSIEVSSVGPTDFEVQVNRSNEPDRNYGFSASGFISASDLGVPSRARKEFDHATRLIAKQDFAQAAQRLNKAITMYPTYAVAYNNLGVIYSRLGEHVREREALQKAISLNTHFALAYVNLGRMNIAAGDFPSAETVLDKAATFDPADPMALILLSYAEFMDRHFEEAIATTHKAHELEKPHAFVHRVAARAFEQKRQLENAIVELKLFLKEEPAGPRADAARKELEVVKTVLPLNQRGDDRH